MEWSSIPILVVQWLRITNYDMGSESPVNSLKVGQLQSGWPMSGGCSVLESDTWETRCEGRGAPLSGVACVAVYLSYLVEIRVEPIHIANIPFIMEPLKSPLPLCLLAIHPYLPLVYRLFGWNYFSGGGLVGRLEGYDEGRRLRLPALLMFYHSDYPLPLPLNAPSCLVG